MSKTFTLELDKRDLLRYQKLLERYPQEFRKGTAQILNSLAVQTRKNDIFNLKKGLIIRDEPFLKRQLRYQKTGPVPINRQIALAFSFEKPRFSGWKEQEYGGQPVMKRKVTKWARGGNMHKRMRTQARLASSNKIYKPSQFQGKNFKSKFQFMMRVLGSRGGGRFLLTDKYKSMGKGLYELTKGKKIRRLQSFDPQPMKPKRLEWRSMSIKQLHASNDINKIWGRVLQRLTRK